VLHDLNLELEKAGITAQGGSMVDVTFIEAPELNEEQRPCVTLKAHQSKKGKNWHFGYKAHIGVDAAGGLVHGVKTKRLECI
jgi:IS5 family transposase